MFAQTLAPEYLAPDEVDDYLERGWFRMGQNIFTTNFVHFHQRIYSTVWLRILLNNFTTDNTQTKIFKRNQAFRTEINPAKITPEKEELYDRYKQSLPFQPSSSVHQLLLGSIATLSIYNTYEVTVYDGDSLIAFGFFDIGVTSAMGISSVYDPVYKKYSLGKYLIYQKIEFCKKMKLQYFYPGYFAPGYSLFDYKLTIGKSSLEFLQLRSEQWLSIKHFSSEEDIPFEVMQNKLKEVQKFLEQMTLKTTILKYEYFDACLIPDSRGAELFDFPIMLMCPIQSTDGINPILVYDPQDEHYHILLCAPVWKPNQVDVDPYYYSSYVLKLMQRIYSTDTLGEIAIAFLKVLKL